MNASLSRNVVGSADKESRLRMRLLTYKLSAISLSAAMTTGSCGWVKTMPSVGSF